MSFQKSDPLKVPGYRRDPASAPTSVSTPSATPCSPAQPAKVRTPGYALLPLTLDPQTSKFKPPRSFVSMKHARDQPSSSTPVLPSKRLSSDPETPPPSSTVQSKRPRCSTGSEKENQFSQETPLGGVTNLIHRQTTASSPKKVVECIDVDHDVPSSSYNSSDTACEFSEVSQMKEKVLARAEQPSGN